MTVALRSRAVWTRLGALDPRYPISFLITLILVLGEARYGILGGYARLVTALGVCTVAELALSRWVRGQLTYRGRHLWNPSNFAISLLLVAAPGSVAILSHQWGNDLATNSVIWCFGLLIVSRVRMLHVTLTYVTCFLVLAAVRSLLSGGPQLAEVAPLTGPMYQLFIFFMVTDPKTTVSTTRGRMMVAAAVALAEAGIRLAGDFHVAALGPLYPAPPIFALAIVGPLAKAIDLYRDTYHPDLYRDAPRGRRI